MRSPARVLIVDDEPTARAALARLLRHEGYVVDVAADAFKALAKLHELPFDVVVTDLKMPGMDGIELTRRALAEDPARTFILLTAFGSLETAADALGVGALDFLTKPVEVEHLLQVIARELEDRRVRAEAGELRHQLSAQRGMHSIIGDSCAMQQVAALVHKAAPTQASVLITGESGTGKELVAQALHELSPRAARPFVKLHCAALAEGLLESELFGHERGAFTGAIARRDGRFQQAHGGTLFLDEIGEIGPSTQVKLLRVLQERELQRVGGNDMIKIDVRIIAATNRDLRQMVADGKFREDLYYRLHVVALRMPPLRERLEDVPALVAHFLRKYAAENERAITGFTDEAVAALTHHGWPGNVRELENTVERAVVLCRGGTIGVENLALAPERRLPSLPPIPGTAIADLERDAILRTLEWMDGSTTRAAEVLGVSARMIQYRLHAYGVPLPGRQRDK